MLENFQQAYDFEFNPNEELKRLEHDRLVTVLFSILIYFNSYRALLLPMIDDTISYINSSYANGERILIEGIYSIFCLIHLNF